MGIKERERRVEVFFYGLFMDEELLRGKGTDRHWWHNLEQRYPHGHDFLAYRHSELLRNVVFTIDNEPYVGGSFLVTYSGTATTTGAVLD